ncbi:MAG: zinc ribbon domain-containing protein [Nitrospiraceae bacterium]|nr:zinc ribbon domain-containing protein [Nitrospiraceae bacterium]
MAAYDYKCNACGFVFEKQHGMDESPSFECPKCRGKAKRMISGGSGFIVKGTHSIAPVQTRCGKEQTCCGSTTPCENGCGND